MQIPHEQLSRWYTARGWTPFPFQLDAWDAYRRGASGLIHAPTGMGKSYAAWFGPLTEWMDAHADATAWAQMEPPPLTVLWITPLRALAGDTTATLQAAVDALGLPWSVEKRTGDTSSSAKSRQRERPPTAMVTTPESLSLLLSYPDSPTFFQHLRAVVVDEWHELLGSKRGVQTELALARLRRMQPDLRVWGLSATLGNLDEALAVLMGAPAADPAKPAPVLIAGRAPKELRIDTLIPADVERFPWAGHLGMKLLPPVVDAVKRAGSTLIFTNTRAQTELWFQALIDAHPEFAGDIALHHGSLDPTLRADIEDRLRDGRLRCVVCTSSLDLGVDFSPVDQVIQIGSPRGVARLMQRAGRSGHRPGAVSRILCVPTHAFELVEFAAARAAIDARMIEARLPLEKPLDVLAQHLVTVALGGGFVPEELLAEVRTTYAYRALTDDEWRWTLDFVADGGTALGAYDQYNKLAARGGIYRATTREVARFHRMSIGTITSDGMFTVKYVSGGSLGSVEESFIARLRPGDRFIFAGRVLELVRTKEMTAYVRKARGTRGIVPRWMGARMPLSSQLAGAVRVQLADARAGRYAAPELAAVRPILAIQARWSHIPAPGELLIESTKTRDGHHVFVFPMAGRLVHEGLSTLVAYRMARETPRTLSAFATDYGFELLSSTPLELTEDAWRRYFSTENLLDDVLACVNETELARRQFRDIARVAGLVFSGYPGSRKSTRQLQASSGILFDVFQQYDPQNMLLDQARREVLHQQLDLVRLESTLAAIAHQQIVQVPTRRLTPLAFPIWTDRMRTQVTSEAWSDRVQRMVLELEEAAGEGRD